MNMEPLNDSCYRVFCTGCLSVDRNLVVLNGTSQLCKMFRLMLSDFDTEYESTVSHMEVSLCWECFAVMRRFEKFKNQVQKAYENLNLMSNLDHSYISQSLTPLSYTVKSDYDKVYVTYYSNEPEQLWHSNRPYITITTTPDIKAEMYEISKEHLSLPVDDQNLEVPELVLKNPETGVLSHIVIGSEAFTNQNKIVVQTEEPSEYKASYVLEYMTEEEMLQTREEMKKSVTYVSSVYKCELCIMEFYTQKQVEEHFYVAHRERPNYMACTICFVYIETPKLEEHKQTHYKRYRCKLCSKLEYSVKLINQHVKTHLEKKVPNGVIQIGDATVVKRRKKKKTDEAEEITNPKPGDLRKLLSKTTISGYKCLECDMFFKNSRSRKAHVAKCHREGLQCDHCKKRFVNRTTLITHLKLHEGPPPRAPCPICQKQVRVAQLKYHVRRHREAQRYECVECSKTFSHLATYQAHLKYSRAHASDNVFKYPCPMCNKGYPSKEAMQDHFNYQHLGKTTHKCPICSKPIASKANVERHIMRVHREKKIKPRNHECHLCGKTFSDKKALTQHEVIHSAERPLTCDICSQTFKQKASLYTHKKRVHKVVPPKRVVEFMDTEQG